MKTAVALVALSGSLVVSAAAWGGTDFVLTVEMKDKKPIGCTLTASPAASTVSDDELKISLSSQGTAQAPAEPLTVVLDGEPAVPPATIATNATGKTLSRGAYANRKLTLKDPRGVVPAEGCKPQMLTASTPAATGNGEETASTPASVQASELNQKALEYLGGKQIKDHEKKGGILGKEFRLYHLPDGTPAFPLPLHISEKDQVELWIALPVGSKAAIDVVACDKAPGYRIKGSYKDTAAVAGKLHGLEEKKKPPVQFLLQPYPTKLQCAGTLTYKIETSGGDANGSTTTSISIDPVYRFEWGVGYGFDFGKPQQLSLGDRPAANGMDTEKFIVASKDFTGGKPIITLGVDVCGTNPSDMTWCDRLLTPTIWVDPTRLDQGFGVGMVFRPIFGVGILVGMSVYKSTAFADGLTANPGDTWTAVGDLPTKKVFNKDSLGLMLAATLDTEIFSALVP